MEDQTLWELVRAARLQLGAAEAALLAAYKSGKANSFGEPYRSQVIEAKEALDRLLIRWNAGNQRVGS